MWLFRISAMWAIAAIILSGCASRSASPEYFRLMLSPGSPDSSLSGFSLVVGPAAIPERLDREDIQQPGSSGTVFGDNLKRWREPLDDALTQELAWYIGGRAPELDVFAYPWPAGATPLYQVSLQISRFESVPSGQLELSGTMILSKLDDTHGQRTRRFAIVEKLRRQGISALVDAHGRAASQLGDQILELLSKEIHGPDQSL